MFSRLGRFTVSHPRLICAAWLILGAVLTAIAPTWGDQTQDDDIRFLPASCPSVRGFQTLERAFPQDVFASRAVLAVERLEMELTPSDLALADRITAAIEKLRRAEPELKITGVTSYRDSVIGRRLLSADRHATVIQISLATPYLAVQTRTTVDRCEAVARAEMDQSSAAAPAVHMTGPAGIGRDLVRASAESLDHTTWATVVLVLIVLLAVYRSPLLALVPLVTIGVSTWIALEMLALMTLVPGVHLVNVSQIFAIVILFGAGTDYCLFLISRYREELASGQTVDSALARTVRAVGGALSASAGTVICGLGMMGLAEFAKIRCAGPAIGLALGVGLAASLTLTPALMRLFGRGAFWPRPAPASDTQPRFGQKLWERLSHWVVARPGWVFFGALSLLAPLALFGLQVRSVFSPLDDLGPNTESIRGLGVIRRHFTLGELGPITVLLSGEADWKSPAGREIVAHLSRGFARLDNVAEVRSLTQPFGEPLNPPKSALEAIKTTALHAAAAAHYTADRPGGRGPRFITRLDVVLRSDPFADNSNATLATIETWLNEFLPERIAALGPVQADCYGVTVHTRDLAAVIERDRARVNGFVMAGTFLILLVIVKRPWLAAYLLATVLISYLATLGLSALFAWIWAGKPLGDIEWRVPFFLFTILVAVGEDYNILMVTRSLREGKRHGPIEGLRRGLARTGGTITACGVIMAGTFGTLMLAGLGTLVQIGFALGIGVLLDTLLVRSFLVPAFMVLVERWREPPVATLPFETLAERLRKAA
jgi:putative drug exporter of the RND superfamily